MYTIRRTKRMDFTELCGKSCTVWQHINQRYVFQAKRMVLYKSQQKSVAGAHTILFCNVCITCTTESACKQCIIMIGHQHTASWTIRQRQGKNSGKKEVLNWKYMWSYFEKITNCWWYITNNLKEEKVKGVSDNIISIVCKRYSFWLCNINCL